MRATLRPGDERIEVSFRGRLGLGGGRGQRGPPGGSLERGEALEILTPADPFSMLIAFVPLIILFEISIILAQVMVRQRKAAEDAAREGLA